MSERLKIYACSGIGDVDTEETYNYWTDNTDTLNNTRAVNSLLIAINGAWIRASRFEGLTDAQRIEYLNLIDLYVVCLEAAKRYAEQPEMLHRAGVVIGAMAHDGLFVYDSTNSKKRDAHLDKLIETLNTGIHSDTEYVTEPDWMNWWKENIEDLNEATFSETEKNKIREAVSGIGDTNIPTDPMKMLYEAGTYYIYTYFTQAQLNKLPGKNRAIVEKKAKYQKQVYNYNLSYCVRVCGSAAKVREVCTQRIEERFGKPINKVIDDMVANGGKIEGVGAISAAVATILTAIISAVVTIVIALINKSAVAGNSGSAGTYQKPGVDVVRRGQMENGDIPVNEGLQTAANFIPFVAIGAAAWYLLSD